MDDLECSAILKALYLEFYSQVKRVVVKFWKI